MSDDQQLFVAPGTVKCPRCGGCGTVTRHRPLRWRDNPVPDAPLGAVMARVIGSFSIFETCQDAAEIASRAARPVAFLFNSLTVVVLPGDDPDVVARKWWRVTYNETPEQTWSRDR